eukprot:Gb_27349 [translate_table: standard]
MSVSMQTSNGHMQNFNFECKKVHAWTCNCNNYGLCLMIAKSLAEVWSFEGFIFFGGGLIALAFCANFDVFDSLLSYCICCDVQQPLEEFKRQQGVQIKRDYMIPYTSQEGEVVEKPNSQH